LPLIRSSESAEMLQAALKNILNLAFTYNLSSEKELHINQVNFSALFDDQTLLKDLLISVLNILISYEDETVNEE
jgi:hypothetical protein